MDCFVTDVNIKMRKKETFRTKTNIKVWYCVVFRIVYVDKSVGICCDFVDFVTFMKYNNNNWAEERRRTKNGTIYL